MSDLRERILAEIERREQTARAVKPVGFLFRLMLTSDELDDEAEAVEHIAANDPATVLRGCAEDRDILTRHQPVDPWRSFCSGHNPDDAVLRESCPEIRSLARRHGIEVAP